MFLSLNWWDIKVLPDRYTNEPLGYYFFGSDYIPNVLAITMVTSGRLVLAANHPLIPIKDKKN